MNVYIKDPDSIVDYSMDWSGYLRDGETVQSFQFIVDPIESGGLSVQGGGSLMGAVTTASVAGGLVGHVYTLTCRAVLNTGIVDDRSLSVRVENL